MSTSDMRKAIKLCREAGLVFESNHKHPRVVQPSTGEFVSFSGSPSCKDAHRNMLRDVRKYLGVDVTKIGKS
jgi:hypothetical protein